jgi:PhoH-like ATPase
LKKQYKILDTNILLLDANNLLTLGKEAVIVLPETVLDELDSKKSLMNELGFQARSFGRLLTKANVVEIRRSGSFTISILSLEDVTIWVVALTKYTTQEGTSYTNDRKILEASLVVSSLPEVREGDVSFVSVDVMARLRGMSLGLTVDSFQEVKDLDFEFTRYISLPNESFHTIHNSKVLDAIPDHVQGTFNYHIENPDTGQVKLCTVENGLVKVIGPETEKELRRQDINPCNAQQLFLSKAIQDPLIDLVAVDSLSGSGKTAISLSNAIRLVKQGKYSSIVYIRNSINDEDPNEAVGFLSGNEEKFAVYLHPLEDTLEFIVRDKLKESKLKGLELEEKVNEGIAKLKAECNIQAMTALGLRGRTFNDSVIVLDEAQNASPNSLQKILTRVGKNCKVIVIGSNRQIDNAYITKHTNGLGILLNASKNPQEIIRMHVVDLHKVVRSSTAEFAEKLFSKDLQL